MSYDIFCDFEPNTILKGDVLFRYHDTHVEQAKTYLSDRSLPCACESSCVANGKVHAFGNPSASFGIRDLIFVFRAYLGRSVTKEDTVRRL